MEANTDARFPSLIQKNRYGRMEVWKHLLIFIELQIWLEGNELFDVKGETLLIRRTYLFWEYSREYNLAFEMGLPELGFIDYDECGDRVDFWSTVFSIFLNALASGRNFDNVP